MVIFVVAKLPFRMFSQKMILYSYDEHPIIRLQALLE